MDGIWERVTSGRLTAVEGPVPPTVPVWLDVEPLVVRCDGDRPFGPLLTARDRLDARRAPRPLWSDARRRVRAGLRRRLLGDPEPDRGDGLVDALNDAATGHRPLLILDRVEAADADTLSLLLRAAHRPGWFTFPVLVVFGEIPAEGPARDLATALSPTAGPEDPPPTVDLPDVARRTLRAAAWLGSPFSADDVATLLGTDRLSVLLDLQDAADHGVPLADGADGTFTLDPAWLGALREGLLPSLDAAWTTRSASSSPTAAPATEDPTAAAVGRARDAWLAGDRDDAVRIARNAADAAADPSLPPQREPRIAALVDLAWFHHQRGELREARDHADAALALTTDADPADLTAMLHAVRAGIAYDIGDRPSLEQALGDLEAASRAWVRGGDPIEAARLLNDQAAIHVRLGDLDRATALLTDSRAVFEGRAPDDPVARLELAETDHLLARLPLHAPEAATPDALQRAVEHARRAEGTYRALRMSRELGRVWETLGRLEIRLGRVGAAIQRLSEAVRVQREIGDDLGLARTTATLSEALADGGRLNEAVSLLADSIALNVRTGTAQGLACNRSALETLRSRSMRRPEVLRALDTLAIRLKKAERDAGTSPG